MIEYRLFWLSMSFKSQINDRLDQLAIKISEMEIVPNELLMRLQRVESHLISLRGYVNKKLNPVPESIETPRETHVKEIFNDGMDEFRGLD